MHILIIGGTRYFGRGAAEQLLEAGHRVTIFSRGNVRPPFWGDIEHIRGDRTDADGLRERLAGRSFDGVIDNQCFNREEADSVIGALRGRVGRYVVASTVSVYGEGGHARGRHTVKQPLTEEERFAVDYRHLEPVRETDLDNAHHPWEYRPNLSAYGEGKRHMERAMLESPQDWPWIVVRVPATLGPGDPSGRFAWWLSRIVDGGPILLPDGGAHAMQVGYSSDLSQFLIRVQSDGSARSIYNYAQPETPALANFLRTMARAAERPLNTVAIPSEVLQRYTELPWEEWSYAPFCYCPLLMSTAKAGAEVGLDFRTPMEEWVRITVDSYLSDRETLLAGQNGEHRSTELEFASRWEAVGRALPELLAAK